MTCLGFIVSFAVVFVVANAPPGCCVTVQIVSFHAINITPFFKCLKWLARPFSPLAKMHFFSLILCDDENSDYFASITSQLMGQIPISLFQFSSIIFDKYWYLANFLRPQHLVYVRRPSCRKRRYYLGKAVLMENGSEDFRGWKRFVEWGISLNYKTCLELNSLSTFCMFFPSMLNAEWSFYPSKAHG